jgi:hypothetical protein
MALAKWNDTRFIRRVNNRTIVDGELTGHGFVDGSRLWGRYETRSSSEDDDGTQNVTEEQATILIYQTPTLKRIDRLLEVGTDIEWEITDIHEDDGDTIVECKRRRDI